MKKVFLLSLGLILGLSAFAQNRSAKMAKTNDTPKEAVISQVQQIMAGKEAAPATIAPMAKPNMTRVANSRLFKDDEFEFEEFETMVTNYDLQSNSALGNRMAAWPDGSAVVTTTRGIYDEDSQSYPGRGTGYNYYDGEDFGNQPEESVEAGVNQIYSGWPSIVAAGNSEYLASHGGGNVHIYKRDVKGTGNWTELSMISGRTWPRLGYTTDGTLHLICADQAGSSATGYTNYINYYRSTDGGLTWTENPYIASLEDDQQGAISADDYVMATNGERVAIMFGGYTYDVFYVLSEDAGLTWTKQTIYEFPYPGFDFETNWNGGNPIISNQTDTIWAADNSLAVAIANDGTVHCAFGLFAWAPSTQGATQFSYWRGQYIFYWNSQYTNEQGGHNIPKYGEWSGDAAHPGWANNGANGISGTLRYQRLWEMTWANEALEEGDPNLNVFGWNSEKTPGSPADTDEYWDNMWGSYRTYGCATMPAICVDDNDNVTVFFASLSDDRTTDATDGPFYLYSVWVHQRINNVWNYPCTEVSLSTDVTHMMDECYSVSGITNAVNNTMWFSYSADDEFDLFLDYGDNGGVQAEATDNTIYAVKLATYDAITDTKDVVYNIYPNPASDYIRISSEANANATITFVNLAGQTVKTINKSLVAGDNTISIDLASGVYFCTVNANGFSKTTKVVVK